jgi:hypothetical protein
LGHDSALHKFPPPHRGGRIIAVAPRADGARPLFALATSPVYTVESGEWK